VVTRPSPRLRLVSGGRAALVVPRPRVICDDMMFAHRAVRAGAGLGVLPTFVASADVVAGALVPVLPRWRMPTGHVFVVTQGRRPPRKVVAFRDAVIEASAATVNDCVRWRRV